MVHPRESLNHRPYPDIPTPIRLMMNPWNRQLSKPVQRFMGTPPQAGRENILPTYVSYGYSQVYQGREIVEDPHGQGGEVVTIQGPFLRYQGNAKNRADAKSYLRITSCYRTLP